MSTSVHCVRIVGPVGPGVPLFPDADTVPLLVPTQQEYENNLRRIQEEHVRRVTGARPWTPCMHDQCSECHGTGMRLNGLPCIHGISCPCPRCSATC